MTPKENSVRIRLTRAASITLRAAEVALCLAAAYQVLRLPGLVGSAVARRIDPALAKVNATMDNIQATTLAARTLIETVSRDYKDGDQGLYWDIAAMLAASTASSRVTEEMLEDIRTALMGGADTRGNLHQGVFPLCSLLIQDLRRDLDRLTGSADATLKPLQSALANLAELTATLDLQVRKASPQAQHTIELLNQSLAELDTLLADPNIQKTLAHVEDSTESVDIALRPWRQRASLLKTILSKVAGMIKVDPTRW
jgi:hypothetical protein